MDLTFAEIIVREREAWENVMVGDRCVVLGGREMNIGEVFSWCGKDMFSHSKGGRMGFLAHRHVRLRGVYRLCCFCFFEGAPEKNKGYGILLREGDFQRIGALDWHEVFDLKSGFISPGLCRAVAICGVRIEDVIVTI